MSFLSHDFLESAQKPLPPASVVNILKLVQNFREHNKPPGSRIRNAVTVIGYEF